MEFVTVTTQSEFDAAVLGKKGVLLTTGAFVLVIHATAPVITLEGSASLRIEHRQESSRVVAWGSSSVEARESSSVEAWGSSRVVAWESSRVVARESSSVVARGSSSVEARESSSVEAWESSSVEARGDVFIRLYSARIIKASASVLIKDQRRKKTPIDNATVIPAVVWKTAAEWCDYYGVEVKDGAALLFKGVKSNYKSERGGDYTPGTTPVCDDWDGGKIECGKGYHLSPHLMMTKEFCRPDKFIAGWVSLSDMAVHPDGKYPQKCKIHKYTSPVWECDIDGKPVPAAADASIVS